MVLEVITRLAGLENVTDLQ